MDVERQANGTFRLRLPTIAHAPWALGWLHATVAPDAARRLADVGAGRAARRERGFFRRPAPPAREELASDAAIQGEPGDADLPESAEAWLAGFQAGVGRWGRAPAADLPRDAWRGYRWVAGGALTAAARSLRAGLATDVPALNLGGYVRLDDQSLQVRAHDLPALGVVHVPVALRAPDGRLDAITVAGVCAPLAGCGAEHAFAVCPQVDSSSIASALDLALMWLLALDPNPDAASARSDVLQRNGLAAAWLRADVSIGPMACASSGGADPAAPGRARLRRIRQNPASGVDDEACQTLAAIFDALAGDPGFEALAQLAPKQIEHVDPRFLESWAALRDRLALARWRAAGGVEARSVAAVSTELIAHLIADTPAMRAQVAGEAWSRFLHDPPRAEDPVAPGGADGALAFPWGEGRIASTPSARMAVQRATLRAASWPGASPPG